MLFCSLKSCSRIDRHIGYPILIISFCLSLFSSVETEAQVIPDNSLGYENSIVIPNVTVKDAIADLIEGGAIRNNSLFHSFSEFNISNGIRLYFP